MGCNTCSVQHESLKSATVTYFGISSQTGMSTGAFFKYTVRLPCTGDPVLLPWTVSFLKWFPLSLHPHQHTLCVLSYDDTKSNWLITKTHWQNDNSIFKRYEERQNKITRLHLQGRHGAEPRWRLTCTCCLHCIVTPGPAAWWRCIVCLSGVTVVNTGAQNARKTAREHEHTSGFFFFWLLVSVTCFQIHVTCQLCSA